MHITNVLPARAVCVFVVAVTYGTGACSLDTPGVPGKDTYSCALGTMDYQGVAGPQAVIVTLAFHPTAPLAAAVKALLDATLTVNTDASFLTELSTDTASSCVQTVSAGREG